MSSLIYMLSKNQGSDSLIGRLAARISRCSETFWLLSSLLLFIVLGPFSAVIVVVALFNLAGQGGALAEPAAGQGEG
ncbi:MAG: hypothetical protein ABFR97_01780 [Thermodesulfobacteriota bacterium]